MNEQGKNIMTLGILAILLLLTTSIARQYLKDISINNGIGIIGVMTIFGIIITEIIENNHKHIEKIKRRYKCQKKQKTK